MRPTLHILAVSAILMLLAAGCGDDDNNQVVVDRGADYLIVGEVVLRPYVDFQGNIHPIYGQENEIDSILFDTSKCIIAKHPSFVDGNNYTYGFSYFNPADSTRFHSGDSVLVKFYAKAGSVQAWVTLLEVAADSTRFISPDNGDTLGVGLDLTVTWHEVEAADWYSVYYVFDTSLVFGSQSRQVYDYAVDTSYTISGEDHQVYGEYHVFITPNTGPIPGTSGNITDSVGRDVSWISGAIYGSAQPGFRVGRVVTIGTGPTFK